MAWTWDRTQTTWKFLLLIAGSNKHSNPWNVTNLIIHYYHVTKGSRVFTLDKLTSNEIFSILISKVQSEPFNI